MSCVFRIFFSISRLADLEQRISSLEKENAYDALVQRESLSAYQRSSVEFSDQKIYPALSHTSVNGNTVHNSNKNTTTTRAEVRKRRTETERGGPVGVKYEVRQRQRGGDPLLGGGAGKQKVCVDTLLVTFVVLMSLFYRFFRLLFFCSLFLSLSFCLCRAGR